MNNYVFPWTIILLKGKKVVLVPIYLESVYARLYKYVAYMTRLLDSYNVASYINSTFLQMFLWKRFRALAPTPFGCYAMVLSTTR